MSQPPLMRPPGALAGLLLTSPLPAGSGFLLPLAPKVGPPAPPAPSCATCPHARALHFTVYCALDEHVRKLPESVGHLFAPPYVQHVPPRWCPLTAIP